MLPLEIVVLPVYVFVPERLLAALGGVAPFPSDKPLLFTTPGSGAAECNGA